MNSLKNIATAVGVDVDKLPDGLTSTLLKAILKACGGDPKSLPDNLYTTAMKAIAETISADGGGGSNVIITDDGNGNLTISGMTVTDNNGNVTIGG